MQLRKEELKNQGKVEAEVSEVTEEDVISAFGVTKDHMLEAAKILDVSVYKQIRWLLHGVVQLVSLLITCRIMRYVKCMLL